MLRGWLSHGARWAGLSLAAAILAACASQTPPPDSPTAVQIAMAAAEINGTGLAPADYSSIGITLAQHACAQWFTTQVLNSQSTGFGQSALSIGAGIAAAAGGPAGAGAAAGASALSALLGAAQSSFGAGASPAAIYGLIQRVQAAWLTAMPTPLSLADAYALVEAFAEQCSLPAIQQAVMSAMMAVPVTATLPSESLSVAPTAAPTSSSPTPSESRRARRSAGRPASRSSSSHLEQEWKDVQRLGRVEAERRIKLPVVRIGPNP